MGLSLSSPSSLFQRLFPAPSPNSSHTCIPMPLVTLWVKRGQPPPLQLGSAPLSSCALSSWESSHQQVGGGLAGPR